MKDKDIYFSNNQSMIIDYDIIIKCYNNGLKCFINGLKFPMKGLKCFMNMLKWFMNGLKFCNHKLKCFMNCLKCFMYDLKSSINTKKCIKKPEILSNPLNLWAINKVLKHLRIFERINIISLANSRQKFLLDRTLILKIKFRKSHFI